MSEQEEFERSGAAIDLLASAFRQLPNLKGIEISNRTRTWVLGAPFFPRLNPSQEAERKRECGRLQLELFLRAAAAANEDSKFGPEKLVLWDERINPGLYKGTVNLLRSDLPLANIAFKNIKVFTWHQHGEAFKLHQDPEVDRCSITQFLNAMEALEVFEFSQPGRNYPGWPQSFIRTLLQEVHWKRLRTIRFPNFLFEVEMFMSFATRHAGTLRSLAFDEVCVRGCSLQTFLTRLRKTLRLDMFVLRREVMTVHNKCKRRYRFRLQDDLLWHFPMMMLGKGEIKEEWYCGLMGDIESFVTGRKDIYPSEKLKEIRHVAGEMWVESEEE